MHKTLISITFFVILEVPKDINTHFLRVDGVKQPSATIYTRQLSQQQQLDLQRHNQQYPPITVNGLKRKIEGIRKGPFHNEPYPINYLKN